VEALKAAGFEVTTEIDDSAPGRDMATIETERAERAEDRAERFSGYAGSASERAASTYAQARQMAEAIPFGQPILADHYSAGRDRRYRDRMGRTYERAFADMDKAEHWEQRATSAEATQSHRESVPATLRRIEKLEAEMRQAERRLNGTGRAIHGEDTPATGRYAEQLAAHAAHLAEQIAYWREQAEASGVKVWGKADFTKGDYVLSRGTWYEVLRVNAKSLTVPWTVNWHVPAVTRANAVTAIGPSTHTSPITYDDIRGRKSADEMAAVLAASQQQAATA
jgi:hypothetical protein